MINAFILFMIKCEEKKGRRSETEDEVDMATLGETKLE